MMRRGLGFRFSNPKPKGITSSGLDNSAFNNPSRTMSTNDSNETKHFEFNKLEWSTTSFKVSDFLRKFTLPQVVKVIEGYYGDDEDSSLGADQILSLHCIKSTDKVVGRDYRGKEVNIPLQCQNKVEVRPSHLKDVYESVEELCSAFPPYVRISQGITITLHMEIIHILYIES